MRIGKLAKMSGKTARTLHFYEELGLLRPAGRTPGGFRLYDDVSLLRIRWIERLQDLGFSLQEIQDFLAVLHEKAHGPDAMLELAGFYRDKVAEVETKLTRLRALRQDLSDSIEYLQGCRSCDPLTQRTSCVTCTPDVHEGKEAPALVAAVQPRNAS
jgi:MerR family transcriptional regulator, copper efflux regulator